MLDIFRKNVPKYFNSNEEEDLLSYLQKEREEYFVVESDNALVGAGGINYLKAKKEAYISWDFFDPEHQGKGFGGALLTYRINHIRNQGIYKKIIVRTAQLTHEFYGKFGFQLKYVKEDFWAPGLDLYYMEIEI